LIILGDCAFYWMGQQKVLDEVIISDNSKVYWLPGNHESWNIIESKYGRYGESPIEIKRGLFYCPIGSSIIINNYRIIFIGGANSIDKQYRTEGVTWFKQEILTLDDLNYIQEVNSLQSSYKTIICSHTCPLEFDIERALGFNELVKESDPTRKILSHILQVYHPEYWFGGHWHFYRGGKIKGTTWQMLDCADVYNYRTGKPKSLGTLDITYIF